MRILLLASAFMVAISAPALACRGTVEFPQASAHVAQSKMSPERKKEIMEQLSSGNLMHENGHRQGDMRQIVNSLRILDGIKVKVGM